ncbi:MAG TPA: hypothetical protein VHC40_02300 [Rhizomicrobium sp.]|jgi:DNA-binding response OmpR family regulator|nr:hypothetical protein [Rhizomicrobium sp.]
MNRLSFDSVDALIYDPVPGNRTATRAALFSLGFRHTEMVSTLDDFVRAVQHNPPDIALCEAQGAADELCETIQRLRQGAAGDNPFIVIIVTAWDKSTALINKVISSGADDMLLRPFSISLLRQRIEAHIERRKGFVITTDYVGPDRRKGDDRGPSGADVFEPPNSLKMKAKDKLPSEAVARKLDTELKAAREKLAEEKLRRDGFQVCVLWRLMQDAPAAQKPPHLAKLQALTRSIADRSRDGGFQPAVECCESVLAAAEGLELNVDRNASMHLLGHAALTLHQIFHPETSAAEQLAEIDAAVAAIRSHTQAEALAS